MQRIRRLCAAILCLLLFILLVCPVRVLAGEKHEVSGEKPDSMGLVWSEAVFDGWSLTWSAGEFYDVLNRAEKDGVICTYTYNAEGYRTAKNVNGYMVQYQYDEAGNLILEDSVNGRIEYIYAFDSESEKLLLSGFRYDGTEYTYEIDNRGSISGILCGENKIAAYDYSNGVCSGVLGFNENGEWVDKSGDFGFIGNINPFRYVRRYLDRETGWYWMGRYYSQERGRFVDGISDEKATELTAVYGDLLEIYCKRYTWGADKNASVSRMRTTVSDEEYIARVLYCESSLYIPDQQGVAWCIKARMNAGYGGQTTAIGTVRYNNEFAGPPEYNTAYPRSDFYDAVSGSGWISACALAKELNQGNDPTAQKPAGFTSQLSFRSVSKLTAGISEDSAGNLYFNGVRITDVAVMGFGSISSKTVIESPLIQSYSGIRNIFFNFE